MRIPLHGGIDVNSEEDVRLAMALLPTPEEIARAKAAAARERAEICQRTGLVITEDGRIVGEAAA